MPQNTLEEDDLGSTAFISYEDSVLFIISMWQYVMTGIAFGVAKPFRKPIWSNKPFLVCTIVIMIINLLFMFFLNPNTPPCTVDEEGAEVCINTPGEDPLINEFLL